MVEISQEVIRDIVDIRRYIHEHPEVSNQEFLTTQLIKERLIKEGIRIVDTNLNTGVIAEIGDPKLGITIALRADIDALPIQEKTNLSYQSKNEGISHACGHDFHTASLIGAAIILKQHEKELNGRVRLVFQPAEEINQGAKAMINAGALEEVSYILGFHNKPDLEIGTIGIKSGPLMASVDRFEIEIKGEGTHAAVPHNGNDPIVTSCQIVVGLQSIVSRHISPVNPAVLSVTHITGGNTWNVIPESVFLEGTIRTFNESDQLKIKELVANTVSYYAKSYNQTSTLTWIESPPVLNNDKELSEIIGKTAEKYAEVINPDITLGGEDFANYQKEIPGFFAFIGTNSPYEWHNPSFLVDDVALITAIKYYVESTFSLLNK